MTSKLPGNQIQPDVQKPTKTPLDLSLDSQRIFRSVGIFCHGFLAGLAFWQLIMVFILTEEMIDLKEFIKLYSPMSQPLYMIFYFLTVICTISIMDRYDIAKFEWRQLQKLLTFKSGGLAIVIYAFSLIITLITTRMDDYLSLYEHNATLFNFEDEVNRDVNHITKKLPISFIKIRFFCNQNIEETLFFTLSECLSNVLITRESNFDERNGQLPRVSFGKK